MCHYLLLPKYVFAAWREHVLPLTPVVNLSSPLILRLAPACVPCVLPCPLLAAFMPATLPLPLWSHCFSHLRFHKTWWLNKDEEKLCCYCYMSGYIFWVATLHQITQVLVRNSNLGQCRKPHYSYTLMWVKSCIEYKAVNQNYWTLFLRSTARSWANVYSQTVCHLIFPSIIGSKNKVSINGVLYKEV